MTRQQILNQVQAGADARLDETIGRLLSTLRLHHTHNSWREECDCEYCRFITGKYTDEKLYLHKLKKKLRMFDNECWGESDEIATIRETRMLNDILAQKCKCHDLKEKKKQMQKDVL